jgi:NAD(P)-dependent dehydrogenase (short-subunit alcohol dehydrogenase family)
MKQTILITGSSGNLGKACVEIFVKKDCDVVATVSTGKDSDFQNNSSVDVVQVDLTNEQMVDDVLRKVFEVHKEINAAVLTVGGFASGNISLTDGTLLKKMISLNFESTYYVARKLYNLMKEQKTGGKLIFIGSRPTLFPKQGKNVLAYALSKSLLFKLAEFINAEEGSVPAFVVVPGTIDTPENRKWDPDGDHTGWITPAALAEKIYSIVSANDAPQNESIIKMFGPPEE